jgi:HD superfamily phosphodiesterase
MKQVRVLICAMLMALAGSAPSPAAAPQKAGVNWRSTVATFAAEHFRHPAWGYSHCVRDYELASALASQDKVQLDDDVLFAAAYLHDMAAFAPWDREQEGVDHADEGARVVDTVLAKTDFPMSKIEKVRGAIRTHMFDRAPVGPEAIYLHDADALDWLGVIGVARIFSLVDPNGGDPDGPKAARMLRDNLSKVPQGVVSPAARGRLPALQKELSGFLADLDRETDGLSTL